MFTLNQPPLNKPKRVVTEQKKAVSFKAGKPVMATTPSIQLRDLGFDSDLTHLVSDDNEARITLSTTKEMLAIKRNAVYWYKGDLLTRKLEYDDCVVDAFFTYFERAGSQKSSKNLSKVTRDKVLVVLLNEIAYIYYKDGRSYTVSFPFKIISGFPYENGLVIERGGSSSTPFITMTDPMSEIGSLVSSSTSSISLDERLVIFPPTSQHSITMTIDEKHKTLEIYHTRFLHRLNNSLSTANPGNLRRKLSHTSRKASLVNINEDLNDIKGDEIKIEKKRSISHSGVLSIDRMASYDYNNHTKTTDSNPTQSSLETLRKDAILTKIESLEIGKTLLPRRMEMKSIMFGQKEAVIIKCAKSHLFEALIFDSPNGQVSFPKLLMSLNFSEKYSDFVETSLPGFIILLSKGNELQLLNPFLNLSTTVYKPTEQIVKFHGCVDSQLVAQGLQGIINFNITLIPKVAIVEHCLSSLKHLTNSYTFNYIWLTWINSFALVKDEWEAFTLTILASLVPFSVSRSDLDPKNRVSELLLQIEVLQKKAIEDEFNLRDMAPNVVLALHLIREDSKLNVLNTTIVDDLGLLLAQLTVWMGWSECWHSYYGFTVEQLNRSIKFPQPQPLKSPPDLMKSLTSLFEVDIVPFVTFSQLAQESEQLDEFITPRTFYVLRLFEAIIRSEFTPKDILNMMSEFKIGKGELDTYPLGIVIPLSEAITFCQEYVSGVDEDFSEYELIDRKDLKKLSSQDDEFAKKTQSQVCQTQQLSNVHQIISSINETPEPIAPVEHDRFNITKLIFSEDRRFYEISKILQTSKIQTFMSGYSNSMLENELLLRQKEIALIACIRNLTVPLGRSSLFYSSKVPLMTENFLIPKITFSTIIQPQNSTVTLETDMINHNALQWGHFHNGASTGLTISRDAKGISGSWIVFNKPNELNAQHGGLLLGLGLNGHLRSLEEWNIYNYLGPKHTYTSVGLLLGMSASLRGTMDVKLTKVLSVHVVALLPQGASDLIVSIPVQTAGLIGIGLLYMETQHRRMSEILLSQITGMVVMEEKEVAEESYRLAAGLALGYINLGKGDDLKGFSDAHLVEKLAPIATFMKDVQSEEAFDKSMSGAILALAFIYLKTNNEVVAKKLKIPDTEQLLDYIRPDIMLLRVLSRNLILWDSVGTTVDWIESQIPESLKSDQLDNVNYFYVLSGLCLSLSIKNASSSDIISRDTILSFYDQITDELDSLEFDDQAFELKLRRQALIQTQMVLALSCSIVMAATGDLETLRRLRVLHSKVEVTESQNAYGRFMATNMALGFLFLGGGQYAFCTSSNFAIAALVTSIYPLFPNCDSSDPEVHLQALRHFWSLSIEPRCLVIRDVETSRPIKGDVNVELVNGQSFQMQAPCLLPDLSTIRRISTLSEKFFKLNVDDLSKLKPNLDIFVYKKRKIDVLKRSVKLILSEINENFEKNYQHGNKLFNLNVFKSYRKNEVLSLFDDQNETDFHSNIIDRQIELNFVARIPKNLDDLWNLKLIFAYYDKILSEEDTHHLSLEFVDHLKIQLWTCMNSL